MYYHEATINFNILTFILNKKSHSMFCIFENIYMHLYVIISIIPLRTNSVIVDMWDSQLHGKNQFLLSYYSYVIILIEFRIARRLNFEISHASVRAYRTSSVWLERTLRATLLETSSYPCHCCSSCCLLSSGWILSQSWCCIIGMMGKKRNNSSSCTLTVRDLSFAKEHSRVIVNMSQLTTEAAKNWIVV